MISPPGLSASTLVFSAAGFIATSTSGASPAVSICGRAEIDLERRDAEQRALRRADFGGKIGERGEIVAGQRGRQRELPAGQLHAVAGIAGKADDDRFGELAISAGLSAD